MYVRWHRVVKTKTGPHVSVFVDMIISRHGWCSMNHLIHYDRPCCKYAASHVYYQHSLAYSHYNQYVGNSILEGPQLTGPLYSGPANMWASLNTSCLLGVLCKCTCQVLCSDPESQMSLKYDVEPMQKTSQNNLLNFCGVLAPQPRRVYSLRATTNLTRGQQCVKRVQVV